MMSYRVKLEHRMNETAVWTSALPSKTVNMWTKWSIGANLLIHHRFLFLRPYRLSKRGCVDGIGCPQNRMSNKRTNQTRATSLRGSHRRWFPCRIIVSIRVGGFAEKFRPRRMRSTEKSLPRGPSYPPLRSFRFR